MLLAPITTEHHIAFLTELRDTITAEINTLTVEETIIESDPPDIKYDSDETDSDDERIVTKHKKFCRYINCNNLGVWGIPGKGSIDKYCEKHKLPHFQNLKSRWLPKCTGPIDGTSDCLSCPSFLIPSENIVKWCSKHAPPNSVSYRERKPPFNKRKAKTIDRRITVKKIKN